MAMSDAGAGLGSAIANIAILAGAAGKGGERERKRMVKEAETLKGELSAMKERHERSQQIFKFMSATAPSMGLIGTIIGLVQMLQNLDDPDSIGPAMAVALLTTLYGAILAFVVYGPIGEKLANRTAEEVATKKLAIAGVESILKGDNSMVIQSKLESFLSPEERAALGDAE